VGQDNRSLSHWLLTRIFDRPDVQFFCDLDYDPFLIMQDQNKVYGQYILLLAVRHLIQPIGFTVSLFEYEATIPTLWNAVKGLSPQVTSSKHMLKCSQNLSPHTLTCFPRTTP